MWTPKRGSTANTGGAPRDAYQHEANRRRERSGSAPPLPWRGDCSRGLLPNLYAAETEPVRTLLALRPVVLPTIDRATTPMRTNASAVYVPERWQVLTEINEEVRAATG
jgi:hypothetical protein